MYREQILGGSPMHEKVVKPLFLLVVTEVSEFNFWNQMGGEKYQQVNLTHKTTVLSPSRQGMSSGQNTIIIPALENM
jgi:hypothetical protein